MVKKNNSDSVEPKIDSTPRSKAPASKKPAEKSASAKTPAGKKPAAKTTKAEVVESAPAAKKPTEKKPAAKKPIEKKPVAKAASSKGAGSKTEGKSAATAAPVTVTATSMLFMAPDLPTPVIDKKRGRPIEDKKTADQGETHVRRRSRRREGELAEGEQLPPNTVVKVRTPREPKEPSNEPTRIKGSTRLEAKKQRRRDGRDAGRRRSSTITESEFLARRESVERTMIVRSKDGKIQLGVLEDKILVEHYVAKASEASLIGNVYLGKVQNVLPSMEAAFVDIGRGRNAVLYSGEVDWELAETGNQPRRIELALKSGDTVLVQVTKDPVGQKGARLTSQVSLPGRYLVYVPNGSMNGISRKLPESERTRLKKILKEVLPEDAGVIVRTAAEGATEEQLTLDVQRLQDQWVDIEKKVEKGNAPVLLHSEPDLLVKIVRDVFNEDFQKMVISGDDSHQVISEYLQGVAPDLLERIEIYKGDKDIFDEYRIGEQIAKALERKVYLPSGGSLVIDRTEAMTVVDVNTGKFVGSGGNLEETVTKNNLEAAEELVRQLRLRDIGGIVVVDFIDMVLESNRDLVLRRLMECLSRDRTKHQVAEVTSLGLVQMTRKKLGIGLLEAFSEPCEACASRGVIVHHEPIMRSKHVGEDPRPPKQSGKSKNRDKKQEVPKVVTGERAAEVGNALTKIAASTLAAHEAAGESSPIVAPVSQVDSTESAESNELLDSVLDALPQPKAPGQGRRRPRSRRGTSSK
ncbi:MAG: Rne/Rng family ribonuclease [Rhodoluna sp.]|nr:Rne/Rng family ribonuclease [Rhodoluna sp.]